ncbi:hypothetical protein EAY15_12090 [Vibrio anguillarum]|nr:hypothetical protein CMV05_16975 [Vibrio anguillarum]MBF4388744.1 hypothetical protein [Vibrio anguillarum]MBF4404008.1 hypothetical protein [Vibrio anguillarum]
MLNRAKNIISLFFNKLKMVRNLLCNKYKCMAAFVLLFSAKAEHWPFMFFRPLFRGLFLSHHHSPYAKCLAFQTSGNQQG